MGSWRNFSGGDLAIPAFRQQFQFHPGDVLSSVPVYWNIIFCHLKVEGDQKYFLVEIELWNQ